MRILVISGSRAKLPDPVYPLGAAIVATALSEEGHEIACFDALRHGRPEEALAQLLESFEPEVCLLSIRNIDDTAFPNAKNYFDDHERLAGVVKSWRRAPLILGGAGFSLMPQVFLDRLGADYGVVGEGEQVVVDLVDRLGRGERPARLSEGNRLVEGFLRADRELFDASWYYEHGGVANIQTKRGCALRCVYCTYPILEGHKSRGPRPEQIVDEMKEIAAGGIRHFFFVDAVFNQPEEHAALVCEEIIRSGLDVSITGYFAPTCKNPELPKLLRRAGCDAVEFGTDALSDPMLESLDKGFTVAEVLECAELYRRAGLEQCHNLIFGGPGETVATIDESLRRMDALAPKAVIVTLGLRVYPGTQLARLASADIGDGNQLEPIFYVEPGVCGYLLENAGAFVDQRPGWICPGLGKRYNSRYLSRLRERRKHKGVLWTLF